MSQGGAWSVDARVPVVLGTVVGNGDAVLTEGVDFVAQAHAAGCGCCGPRSPAALALDRLFLERVRANASFGRIVVRTVTTEGDRAVRAALRDDPVVAARFRVVLD